MTYYNLKFPQRKSMRLKNYDYSQAGLYFITICVDRLKNPGMMPFGYVKNGEMILNNAGKMVEKWYWELENKYPDKRCHEMVIMPNHIHFIIENLAVVAGDHAGPTLCGRPQRGHPQPYGPENKKINSTIAAAIGWFVTMTTNEYIRGVKSLNWQPYNKKLWQRSYWDVIIRNEQSYQRISNYIKNNPVKWDADKLYTK